MFWNYPIKFLKQSFSVIVICCLLNIKYMSWKIDEAILNSSLSTILFAFLLLYPALIQIFLYKR